jgi:hypothetical protein
MEGFRRQGRAVFIKTAGEFRRQMLRIRGAAAVAEEQNFMAVAKPAGDDRGGVHDLAFAFLKELSLDSQALGDELVN